LVLAKQDSALGLCYLVLPEAFAVSPGQDVVDVRDVVKDWQEPSTGRAAFIFPIKVNSSTLEVSNDFHRIPIPERSPVVWLRATAHLCDDLCHSVRRHGGLHSLDRRRAG